MILVIDNYDSFTYNLVHLIGVIEPKILVRRNDALTVNEALNLNPKGIVLSPGPCTPEKAGICVDLVNAAKENSIPLLGVCLGHQAITVAAGGRVIRAGRQMHGRTSEISHHDTDIFSGLPSPLTVTRYHSLVSESDSLPDSLQVTAKADDDGEIMGLRWKGANIFGVQFHPESIASESGDSLVRNFLETTRAPSDLRQTA